MCKLPGQTVATDFQGDQAASGTSQHDIVALMFAEPPQPDGVDRLAVTMKVRELDPANLPPYTSWRTYFFVGSDGPYFVSIDKEAPADAVKFQYGATDDMTGMDVVLGQADSGALSAAEKTLTVIVASDKIGNAQAGSTLIDITGETQLVQPAKIVIDRGPNDNPSPATYRLVGNATCSPLPVELRSVASRQAHSGGALDINLPPAGEIGIECRSGGPGGNFPLVFSFANPLSSVGGASVTSGVGTVSSSAISGDGGQYIVNLTGVTNAQVVTVTLTDVNDTAGNRSAVVTASMGVLLGDTTGNGIVNSSDISQAKSQSGTAVTVSNFRADVTANGAINSSDISLIKSQSGTAIP